jgi:hypothetical protein
MLDSLLSANLGEKLSQIQERQQKKMQVSPELQQLGRDSLTMPPMQELASPQFEMQQSQPMQQVMAAPQMQFPAFVSPMQAPEGMFTFPPPFTPDTPPPFTPDTPPQEVQPFYVSSAGEEDDQGRTSMQRLEALTAANKALIPEGYEAGFESSSNIHLMYTGLAPRENELNPDYEAGMQGNTVGGIGNTDPWGEDITWSEPTTWEAKQLGDIIETPAGTYLVVNGADGKKALMGLNDAKHGGGQYFYNMVNKGHHVGINPNTGDVWYQQAPDYLEIPGYDYMSSITWDPETRRRAFAGELPPQRELEIQGRDRDLKQLAASRFKKGLESGLGSLLGSLLYGSGYGKEVKPDKPLFGEYTDPPKG